MAERGLLRKVEVISTVSGGSIVGAQLYLHLKDLHENVPAEEITDAHFVKLVEHLETSRSSPASSVTSAGSPTADLPKNWRMRRADYSRSDRLGELYRRGLLPSRLGRAALRPARAAGGIPTAWCRCAICSSSRGRGAGLQPVPRQRRARGGAGSVLS